MTPEITFWDWSDIPRTAQVLDIGCGDHKKVPWAVGLDGVKTPVVDVVHDLNAFPWPFADSTFDLVIASHVAEHVRDVLAWASEVHRICKPGAQVRIATPHFSSPDAFVDPTHLHHFGYRSFEYMAASPALPRVQRLLNRLAGTAPSVAGWYTSPKFEIVGRTITFRKPHRLLGLDRLARHAPLAYEYFLSGLAPARDMQVALRAIK